jgi:hypothetical protein
MKKRDKNKISQERGCQLLSQKMSVCGLGRVDAIDPRPI